MLTQEQIILYIGAFVPQAKVGINYKLIMSASAGVVITDWNVSGVDCPSNDEMEEASTDVTSESFIEFVKVMTAKYQVQTQTLFNAFFDKLMPTTHQALYKAQQSDLEHWVLSGSNTDTLPRSVIREWEVDKSQRLNEEGWIEVSAIIPFKCFNELDLLNTWRINTEFMTWLREEGKPLRSYADAMIAEFIPSGEDILTEWVANANSLVHKLETDLTSLPTQYVQTILPSRIATLGLEPIQ